LFFQHHCNVVHVSISYMNELMSFISRTFGYFSCCTRIFFIFKTFVMFIVLGKQGWFISCYKLHCIMISFWPKFINVKILSTCHVIDMWTCVVSLSFMCICWQKESMAMQKVRMENAFPLACGNNHDGAILILCIVHSSLFTSFFVS